MSDVKKGGARMIKCCRWKPSGQIVVGACDPVSPNCEPGYFLTVQELEKLKNQERRALKVINIIRGKIFEVTALIGEPIQDCSINAEYLLTILDELKGQKDEH